MPRGDPGWYAPQTTARLGDLLVERSLLTPAQLRWALDVQRRTGSRLGDILIAWQVVHRLHVYRALSDLWGCPFVDLTVQPIQPSLLHGLDPRRLITEQWIPVRQLADGIVLVATAEPPNSALLLSTHSVFPNGVVFAATTDWDIRRAVNFHFADFISEEATLGLWRHSNDRSAREVVTRPQRISIIVFAGVLAACAMVRPVGTLVVLSAVLAAGFLAMIAFKFVVCMVGTRYEQDRAEVSAQEIDDLEESELPMYTVLVPAYHEANVVGGLMKNLSRLDYPSEKLEILLLLEADDDETRQAAMAARPPGTVTFITVPPGPPQTKPKACNVGLMLARGEFLVIYDAEDQPDPQQLKAALVAFRQADERQVCVQAALNYFNAEENTITRMFTLEYSFWFDYMLPGLEALRLPIPLGGTSNHFRTAALRRLGGWDPFNVTEDADLGIRSAAVGQTVGVISSTTFEEANTAYGNFVRQRSRWIKGYLQTTLVHLRHPVDLVRTAGWGKTLGFALLVGGTPLTFLCLPPLYLLFVVSFIVGPSAMTRFFPGWVLWASLASLFVGNSLMIYVSMMGVFKRRRYRLVLWALLNPVYWLLHAAAAYKALWQLVVRPHYWEKTVHGLSRNLALASDNSAMASGPLAS